MTSLPPRGTIIDRLCLSKPGALKETWHLVVEIDLGIQERDLAGFLQFSVADQHANRDQHQAANEESRQKQEEDDAEVGVGIGPAEHIHQPIADHGHTGSAGNGSAGKTDGIVAEEQRRPHPAFTEFL